MKGLAGESLRQRGKPEINIAEEQLAYLLEQSFRTKDINALFGCNRRTIERRMTKINVNFLI